MYNVLLGYRPIGWVIIGHITVILIKQLHIVLRF